ncbi:MAG: hypothetical protein WD766_02765 [Gemmatimonadota bacterium]
MRILIDEDLDVRPRHHFGKDHHVETVQYRGWKGLKNGRLLTAASPDFDVLLTADHNLLAQQNLSRFDIAVMVLVAKSKRLPDLLALLPEVLEILPTLKPGTGREVGSGSTL